MTERRIDRLLDGIRFHTLLALSLVLVILPHLLRLPVWLDGLMLGLILWRWLYDAGRVRLPGRGLRLLLVALGAGGILLGFHTLIGRDAGSALILLLLCLKLTEMHQPRDFMVVLYLAYFIVIIGFLFSQSMFMALYMLLVLLALLTLQISLHHRPGPSASLRTPLPLRQHGGLALQLLLQALPLALLLFLLFPRIPGPLWGLPEDAFGARTGLSDEMSPGRISRLSNDDSVAFRVHFEGTPPPRALRYWRGPVLWNYDGHSWRAPRDERLELRDPTLQALGPPLRYSVTLEPHRQHWLFALDIPAQIPAAARMSVERQLLATEPVTKLRRYAMTSYSRYRIDDTFQPYLLRRYLGLPPASAPRTRQFMQRLRARHPDPAALIRAVLDHFRSQPFYYTRTAPLLLDDPVDEFLFDSRRGFCEHYASAFTVMMRLAGIPARVVTGYQGGEMNPLADYMIVRQADAHAWSEVWLEGEGWVRIDPTAVIPPARIEYTADLQRRRPGAARARDGRQADWLRRGLSQARFAWDAVNNRWNLWVVGFNQRRQGSLFRAFGVPEIHWQGLAALLAGSFTLVLGLLGLHLLRRPKVPQDPLQQSYRRFCRRLAPLGFRKALAETPSRFAARVSAARSDLDAAVWHITRLYNRLRYGPPGEEKRAGEARLRQAVKQFRPTRRGG
jgi:transglutaminase-like putative cysteine protease